MSIQPCAENVFLNGACFRALVVAAVSSVLAAPVRAQFTEYGVGKIANYTQSNSGQVAANPGAPFEFAAEAQSYTGTVTGPGGQVVQLTTQTSNGYYESTQTFATQAAMDAAFPSGTYTFNVQTQGSVPVSLTGDEYPPVPEVVNGFWASGALYVDPNSDFLITFDAFPGYGTLGADAAISVEISQPALPDPYDATSFALTTPTAPTSITLPAGTLSGGNYYTLTIGYTLYPTANSTSVPGAFYFSAYETKTTIDVYAVAPPAAAPSITLQPQSQTVPNGATVVFKCNGTGTPAPAYKWYFNGAPTTNTQPTLTLSGATVANAGSYFCVVSNASGSVTSSTATLGISSTNDVGRLVNISTRGFVSTGANIMIAGFTVGPGGAGGNQSLLIRASGPALGQFNLTGLLSDPQLGLYSGQNQTAFNSGWQGNAAIAAAAQSVSAFSWQSAASHDSALLSSVAGGAGYTAQVSGESGDTGVALVEVYDETPAGTYTPSKPRLTNISTRMQVGTGANIMIAGFVIGGSTSRTMLIRASGPALSAFSIPGVLPDPQLQLYSGSNVIASNTGWGGDPAITAAASGVGAFAWDNSTSADSAILLTLPPGSYTAQVSGASGDTGVALIEVYEVP